MTFLNPSKKEDGLSQDGRVIASVSRTLARRRTSYRHHPRRHENQ